MLREGSQPLFDVARLRPNATGNQLFVEVGQVCKRGKALSQSFGIENRESHPASRQRRKEAQHR